MNDAAFAKPIGKVLRYAPSARSLVDEHGVQVRTIGSVVALTARKRTALSNSASNKSRSSR